MKAVQLWSGFTVKTLHAVAVTIRQLPFLQRTQEFCEDCPDQRRHLTRDPALADNALLPAAFQVRLRLPKCGSQLPDRTRLRCEQLCLAVVAAHHTVVGTQGVMTADCNGLTQVRAGDTIYAALRNGFPTADQQVCSQPSCSGSDGAGPKTFAEGIQAGTAGHLRAT